MDRAGRGAGGGLSQTVKSARGLKLTTHLHTVQRLCIKGAIPLLPLYAFLACKGIIFALSFSGFLQLSLFLILASRQCLVIRHPLSVLFLECEKQVFIRLQNERQNYLLPLESNLDLINSSFW